MHTKLTVDSPCLLILWVNYSVIADIEHDEGDSYELAKCRRNVNAVL